MYLVKLFKSSARELSSPQVIAISGMLLAIRVVLGYFSNITLAFLPTVKFGFNFLPVAICAIMFGPVVAGIISGLGDILSYILNSTGGAYFPGWTINAIVTGVIFGMFLYKNNVTLAKIIISTVLITIFVELLLGSLWLQIQFDKAFVAMLGIRSVSQLIIAPVEIIILFVVSKTMVNIKLPALQNKNFIE